MARTHTVLAAFCLLGYARHALSTPRVTIGTRTSPSEHSYLGWNRATEQCTSEPVKFTVYLKQQNLDQLNAAFHEISDPRSTSYGQFLTKDEVDQLVGAKPETIAAVVDWLGSNAVDNIERRADTIVVHTTCAVASKLLDVPFYRFEQVSTRDSRMLYHGRATIPHALNEHIDFMGGISELWHGSPPRVNKVSAKSAAPTDLKVTPKLLREYYGVPDNETNASPEKNYQAVAAFNDYFSEGALTEFYAKTDGGLGDAPILDVKGVECLNGAKKCDQVESDLDVQYMTAMAGSGSVKTLFHNNNASDGWVLGFSENALELSPLPLVFSVSYGWAELRQCEDIAIMVCSKLGYTSKQYVDRTNVNFQKLAVQGVSILVSDGDDGAQGNSPSGWNPLDLDHWCGDSEYACYPRTSSKCGEVVLHNKTTGDKCIWPVGHMGPGCEFLFSATSIRMRTLRRL